MIIKTRKGIAKQLGFGLGRATEASSATAVGQPGKARLWQSKGHQHRQRR